MDTKKHADITEAKFGVRAEDIHHWMDEFFDHHRFYEFQMTGRLRDFNPYDHRKHRHHSNAIDECIAAFHDKYDEKLIRQIFEQHIRDDYDGYYPTKDDFDDDEFHQRHHRK